MIRMISVMFVLMLVVSGAAAQDRVELLPDMTYVEFQLSPDGQTIAVYQNAQLMTTDPVIPALLPITLVDFASREPVATLSGYTDYVADVAFSPDGSRMVSFHTNGDLIVWSTADSAILKIIETTMLGGGRIDFMPDGKTLVMLTPGMLSRFLLWDIDAETITGIVGARFDSLYDYSETAARPPTSFNYTYLVFDISPDGKSLAVSTGNDSVILWDIATNRPTVVREPDEGAGDFSPGHFSVRSLAFTPDGKYLVFSVAAAERIVVWDIAAQAEAESLDTLANIVSLSLDGRQIAWLQRVEDQALLYISPLPGLNPVKVADINARPLPFASVAFVGDQLIVGGLYEGAEAPSLLIVDQP